MANSGVETPSSSITAGVRRLRITATTTTISTTARTAPTMAAMTPTEDPPLAALLAVFEVESVLEPDDEVSLVRTHV